MSAEQPITMYDPTNTLSIKESRELQKLIRTSARKYEESVAVIHKLSLVENISDSHEEMERLEKTRGMFLTDLRRVMDLILNYRQRIRENEQSKDMNDFENIRLSQENITERIDRGEKNRTSVHNVLMSEIQNFQNKLILLLGNAIPEEVIDFLREELPESGDHNATWELAYSDYKRQVRYEDMIRFRKLYESGNTSLYIQRVKLPERILLPNGCDLSDRKSITRWSDAMYEAYSGYNPLSLRV